MQPNLHFPFAMSDIVFCSNLDISRLEIEPDRKYHDTNIHGILVKLQTHKNTTYPLLQVSYGVYFESNFENNDSGISRVQCIIQ